MTININGTTGISGVDGSAGTPAIQGSDTNTGINFGTNEVSVSTDGSTRLTIDSSGRLLHGTSESVTGNSETRNVQIVTDVNNANQGLGIYAFTASNNAPRLDLGSSPNGTINSFTTASSVDSLCGRINFLGSDGDEFLPTARIEARVDGTASNGDMPGRLAFLTTADSASSPTERMRITSGGTIQLYAATNGSNQTIQFGDPDADNRGLIQYRHGTDALHIYTAGSQAAMINSDGRLLVGTSTARSRFFNASGETPTVQIESSGVGTRGLHHLSLTSNSTSSNEGAGAFAIFGRSRGNIGDYDSVSSGDAIGSLSFQGADDTDLVEAARITAFVDATPGANDMPGRLSFYTTADGASSPTERMRIDRRGYTRLTNDAFGGSPARSTGVHHYAHNNLSGDWVMVFENTTTGPFGILVDYSQASPNNTGREFFYAEDSSGQRFGLRSNGGLANYSGNNVNLCDEREKKNIVDLEGTWDCLKHWELKKFHYNEDADDSDLRYGVIAQQIAPHCPEVISDWVKQRAEDAVLDEDGNVVTPAKEEIVRMSVKEQQMMWMAIKALQEAQIRIETLEARLSVLEGGAN